MLQILAFLLFSGFIGMLIAFLGDKRLRRSLIALWVLTPLLWLLANAALQQADILLSAPWAVFVTMVWAAPALVGYLPVRRHIRATADAS